MRRSMHCEHVPQCVRSFEKSHGCAQLTDELIRSPHFAFRIFPRISPLVFQMKGFSTVKVSPATALSNCSYPRSVLGCVVRVAFDPTTCAHAGRFMLTTPFS